MSEDKLRKAAARFRALVARKEKVDSELKDLKAKLAAAIPAHEERFGVRHDVANTLIVDNRLEKALDKLGLGKQATATKVSVTKVKALAKIDTRVPKVMRFRKSDRILVVS